VPYLSAYEVVFHEEALYQVYVSFTFYLRIFANTYVKLHYFVTSLCLVTL